MFLQKKLKFMVWVTITVSNQKTSNDKFEFSSGLGDRNFH